MSRLALSNELEIEVIGEMVVLAECRIVGKE